MISVLTASFCEVPMLPPAVVTALAHATVAESYDVESAGVVVETGVEDAETLFAASNALITYEYVVDALTDVSAKVVAPVVVPIGTPARKTLYPATPTLSLEALHERSTSVDDAFVTVRPPGTEGGVTSRVINV
jgi:hypothetical protein